MTYFAEFTPTIQGQLTQNMSLQRESKFSKLIDEIFDTYCCKEALF